MLKTVANNISTLSYYVLAPFAGPNVMLQNVELLDLYKHVKYRCLETINKPLSYQNDDQCGGCDACNCHTDPDTYKNKPKKGKRLK